MFWTFVDRDRIADGRVVIDGPGGHHLSRVLRVRVGEQGVVVADGREHEVDVIEVRPGRVVATVRHEHPAGGEPRVRVVLLQSVLPNPDFDAALEAGTAVGISRFVAVEAARSVARPTAERLRRWQSIVRSAAEQSHRGCIPTVTGPIALSAALAQVEGRFLLLDPHASAALGNVVGDSRYTVAVGPEGGWTNEELAMMREHGATGVNLGPRILRARLAPIVAAAILVQQS